MTSVDLDKQLVGIDGTALQHDGKMLKVGQTLANCLLSGRAENVSEGVATYLLAERLKGNGWVSLSPEEVVRIHKAVIASNFTMLVTGQLLILLEAK